MALCLVVNPSVLTLGHELIDDLCLVCCTTNWESMTDGDDSVFQS